MAIERILHASDFSKASRPALKLALEMAKSYRAEVILFHAYQWPIAPVMGEAALPPKALDELLRAERGEARRKLEGLGWPGGAASGCPSCCARGRPPRPSCGRRRGGGPA